MQFRFGAGLKGFQMLATGFNFDKGNNKSTETEKAAHEKKGHF